MCEVSIPKVFQINMESLNCAFVIFLKNQLNICLPHLVWFLVDLNYKIYQLQFCHNILEL